MPREEVEILLVEDDPEDVQLTLHALHNEKLVNRVQVVRDGEEALDFLFPRGPYNNRDRSCHPRLILLDLKLPKVDGLEILRQLKQDPRTRLIPVVILTSSKQEQDVIASYQLGVNSYIQKPMDFDQFRATIKQLGYYWLLVNQPPPVTVLRTA
jgi:two-component system response regulator